MKICTKCKIEKPSDQFGKEARKKDGLSSNCKECRSKQKRTIEAKNQPSQIKRWASRVMKGLNLDGRDY